MTYDLRPLAHRLRRGHRPRQARRRRARDVAVNDDGTGHIPDEILLAIFSQLPMISIARVAAVCKRWNRLFHNLQLDSLVLDSNQEYFNSCSPDMTEEEWVAALDLCLRLLKGNKLKQFKFCFSPPVHLMPDLNKCLQRVAEKEVEELELDFCNDLGDEEFKLPACLFECKTITHFRLGYSDFRIPSDFSGFSFLIELRLSHVNITDEMLDTMLATCPSMEILYLLECSSLFYIRVCGTKLQLKSLAVMNMDLDILDICVPNLRTFHFNGDSHDLNITNFSSLMDAVICAAPPDSYDLDFNWVNILDKLRCVEILTLSGEIILDMHYVEDMDPEILPVAFGNLNELQILLFQELNLDMLIGVYIFFQHCTFPSLEKLFIELDVLPFDLSLSGESTYESESDLPDHVLSNLRMVKISSFHGYSNEIPLVKFLLHRAVALEFLVLVAAVEKANSTASFHTHLCSVFEQLLILPKASSKAQIMLHKGGEDDGFVPRHTKSHYAPHY